LVKVEPRGFSNEYRTLFVLPDDMPATEQWLADERSAARGRAACRRHGR
jgi:hypothetical protein